MQSTLLQIFSWLKEFHADVHQLFCPVKTESKYLYDFIIKSSSSPLQLCVK